MDDSESNTLIEKDIVEVAERKDRADDPMHADGKFRNVPNGTDALTNVQRLWLQHPVFPTPPQRRARARPQDGCAVSVRLKLVPVLSGLIDYRVGESPDENNMPPVDARGAADHYSLPASDAF